MSNNLCIDIGNSRIKIGVFNDQQLTRFAIFNPLDDFEILQWLEDLSIDKGIYSSVLISDPDWLQSPVCNGKLIKLTSGIKTALNINYQSPETLGTDRIAAMNGAIGIYPEQDLLIVNAGTCITFDFVNREKVFLGGNIAPGLEMRWRAMHEFTAALPLIKQTDDNIDILGKNTHSALQKGGIQGIVFEIEGYFKSLLKEYPDLKCILTGGSTSFLVNRLKIDNFAEPYLVLKGLNSILNYQ